MFKSETATRQRRLEVAILFLKLGLTAFGGPAAHVALMHNEVVTRRHWIDEQRFLDLFGAANMIPGPSSTELAIYLGYQYAGWIGLVLGGVCFILPAMLIVLVLAWAYVQFGATAEAGRLFYGIKPVVIAIVAQALWNLGRKAVKNVLAGIVGSVVIGLYLLGVNVITLLVTGGGVMLLIEMIQRRKAGQALGSLLPQNYDLVVGSSRAADLRQRFNLFRYELDLDLRENLSRRLDPRLALAAAVLLAAIEGKQSD